MSKKLFIYIFILIAFAQSQFAQKQNDIYYEIAKSIDLFGRVYKEITLRYLEEIDPREFMLAGIEGMLNTLDPYTTYIDEANQKDIDLMTTGKYGGIGATIGLRNDKITVVDLIEGYSAQRQGLRIGDVIVKIDSIVVGKNNYDQLSLYMKGDPGTLVAVTVQREAVERDLIFNLIREEIQIKNLSFYGFVPEESSNVYLKLSGFSRTAGEEIKDAILELSKKKIVESIILDLRGNPGGLLDAAISVADKFLKKDQLIVSVVGRDTNSIQEYYSVEQPVAGDADLIVMIDEGSASASEIVAGAIQDHDRGVILGANSFGKGLVQNVIPLSASTSLKLTTGKYLTPSGRSIQKFDISDKKIFLKNLNQSSIEEYRTDGNRSVYSGGGIEPDTIITNNSGSELVQDMLAQGCFFKFATNYFNTNEIFSWDEINHEEVFDSFKEYFSSSDVKLHYKVERIIDQLKTLIQDVNINGEVLDKLNEIDRRLSEIRNEELDNYKDDVLAEIHQEISARIEGRLGRIKTALKYDNQLKSAIEILESAEKYSQILALANNMEIIND